MFCLDLIVVPRSSMNKLVREAQGLKLKITAPPVDGMANAEIVVFLAKSFSCPKSTITLCSGRKSKYKRYCFHQLTQQQGQQKLEAILGGV